MNEIKKQLMAKIGDTSEQKTRVIKRVNNALDSKSQKEKKFAWGYYVTFASFIGIFVVGLLLIPKLMNEQASQNEDNLPVVEPVDDPIQEPTEENGYYDDLIKFFPPNGTVATFKSGNSYTTVETNWLSDRYVQETIYVKDCVSCSSSSTRTFSNVFRITNEEIQQIYYGDPLEWTIQKLDQRPSLGVQLTGPIEVGTEIGIQKIVAIDAELSIDYGTFSNVVVVEGGAYPTTQEIPRTYYVPNYGVVKGGTEEFGYELVSISFDNEVTDKENDYNSLLKSYFFPPEDIDQFFIGGFENGGAKVQTRWLSGQFVQQISYNGGGTIERIYKITENQIVEIYEKMIEDNQPSDLTISELEQLPTLEIVMKAPFTVGDVFEGWTLVDTNGQVSTMYGVFEDVLIVESKTENYLSRRYFATGFGEVKIESMFYNEETGKYEEGVTTELASFGQIMNEVVGNYKFRVFEEEQYKYNSIDEEETSPLNTKRAILHGRAGDFEGINRLVIEDLETGKFTIYKYRYEGEQNTPKDIEWIDENRLYVIIGYAYGTVTMGGNLYILNVEDHSITPVFEDSTNKEEIMTIGANGDGTFTYKKHIYEDEEFNVGHIEEGILSSMD